MVFSVASALFFCCCNNMFLGVLTSSSQCCNSTALKCCSIFQLLQSHVAVVVPCVLQQFVPRCCNNMFTVFQLLQPNVSTIVLRCCNNMFMVFQLFHPNDAAVVPLLLQYICSWCFLLLQLLFLIVVGTQRAPREPSMRAAGAYEQSSTAPSDGYKSIEHLGASMTDIIRNSTHPRNMHMPKRTSTFDSITRR
jgi:hypothetical protein